MYIDSDSDNPLFYIDVRACPKQGTTPLHDALEKGSIEVARLLMEKGGVDLLYAADKEVSFINSSMEDCQVHKWPVRAYSSPYFVPVCILLLNCRINSGMK